MKTFLGRAIKLLQKSCYIPLNYLPFDQRLCGDTIDHVCDFLGYSL